jgi:hypothetical protein
MNVYQKYTEIEMTALEFLIFYKKNCPDILQHLREKRKKPVCGVVIVVVSHGFSKTVKDRDMRFFAKDQELVPPGLKGSVKQYVEQSSRY